MIKLIYPDIIATFTIYKDCIDLGLMEVDMQIKEIDEKIKDGIVSEEIIAEINAEEI